MDKRIKEAIKNEIQEKQAISTDEAVAIVKMYAPKPDPVKLENQWYKRVANSCIAGIRDEEGTRNVFNICDERGERVYVSVPDTDNLNHLRRIKAQLDAKYSGLNKSKIKVQNREKEVSDQLSFDFQRMQIQ